MDRKLLSLSLFWRTFFLLSLLLTGGVIAWVQTLRQLEFEPRAVLAAQQIASLVNLSRGAMKNVDGITRISLMKSMTDQEAVRVLPREPSDRWEPYEVDAFTRRIAAELRVRLGEGTVVARSVNGQEALWVGFTIDDDRYWLQAESARVTPLTSSTWFVWVGIALLATIIGSATIAGLINRPLKDLSTATARIREGEYDIRLDERVGTPEVRAVNIGFNRMARDLAKVEQDRTVMLAGISHDLRTPLTKLRLGVEILSAQSEPALVASMTRSVDEMDAIVGQFLDHARGDADTEAPRSFALDALAHEVAAACADHGQALTLALATTPAQPLRVELLRRALVNLVENAFKHGRGPVTLRTGSDGRNIWAEVADQGDGISAADVERLRQPFQRAQTARNGPPGAGLGLSIVERAVRLHGGELQLLRNEPRGLDRKSVV